MDEKSSASNGVVLPRPHRHLPAEQRSVGGVRQPGTAFGDGVVQVIVRMLCVP